MLDSILDAAVSGISFSEVAICTGVSLVLGILVAAVYMFRNPYSRSFVLTLVLLPAIVQSVIMIVNGNLGTGVAVMGAFSLIRFRSAPGSAREIVSIFYAMAIGLATGMGYVSYAVLFGVILAAVMIVYEISGFGKKDDALKSLRITIPEDLDYSGLFDDIFDEYTRSNTLERVRTTNLGSLYELQYTITLKSPAQEKEMLDSIRQRNGNLNITCGRVAAVREEL